MNLKRLSAPSSSLASLKSTNYLTTTATATNINNGYSSRSQTEQKMSQQNTAPSTTTLTALDKTVGGNATQMMTLDYFTHEVSSAQEVAKKQQSLDQNGYFEAKAGGLAQS